MKIKVLETFLHGRAKLQRDRIYDVPENFGVYFIGNKWAVETNSAVASETISREQFASDAPAQRDEDSLEIQDARLGVKGG